MKSAYSPAGERGRLIRSNPANFCHITTERGVWSFRYFYEAQWLRIAQYPYGILFGWVRVEC